MFSYKKIAAIVTSVLYIFVNYDFYNSIFHEYTNDRLFHTTTYLGIVELFFFIMLFLSVFQLENMETKKKGDQTRAEKEKEGKKECERSDNLLPYIYSEPYLHKYFPCNSDKFTLYK